MGAHWLTISVISDVELKAAAPAAIQLAEAAFSNRLIDAFKIVALFASSCTIKIATYHPWMRISFEKLLQSFIFSQNLFKTGI